MINFLSRLKNQFLFLSTCFFVTILLAGCLKPLQPLPGNPALPQDTVITPVSKDSVSTFAGNGQAMEADGIGTAAGFNQPYGIASDAAGNIYVVDQPANVVRKITPAGVVTTIIGSGGFGEANGAALQATFSYPSGIAIDAAGNIYLADEEGMNITRKITPDGTVSTLCASAALSGGSTNGLYGIAVDAKGNVYQSDMYNNQVRKITPDGTGSIFAGSGTAGAADGTGTSATLNYPNGLVCDAAGNVFVADWGNRCIRKITPAGVVTTVAPVNTHPVGITINAAGYLFMSDGVTIDKISPAGKVTLVTGTGANGFVNGPLNQASFYGGFGIALDPSGNLFVADANNNVIRKVGFN
jgi:hypothetical protein